MRDCVKCEFAKRDERGRFLTSCSGSANCDFQEYTGPVDMYEEDKDELIKVLKKALELACKDVVGPKGLYDSDYYMFEAKEFINNLVR